MADEDVAPTDTDEDANLPAVQDEKDMTPHPDSPHGFSTDDHDRHQKLMKWSTAINIADELEDDLLSQIGQRVVREYDIDDSSRNDWKTKTKKAMDLAMQVAETKQYPWPKASNVIYPLMTTAAIQFAARAYPAIVSGRAVVKGVVVGDDTGVPQMNPQTGQPLVDPTSNQPVWAQPPGARAGLAAKIGDHMSWQLLDEQPEWEEETDKLLHILPIAGCVFRKTYFDSAYGRNASVMVSAMKVVINYNAKSLDTAPRITEEVTLYPLEINENERSKVFLPIEYGTPQDGGDDEDAPHLFLEQHRYWDLDGDDYPEPYIVTVHKESQKVVRIVARFDHDGVKVQKDGTIGKIIPIQYFTKYDFLPNPEGGIYGVGFGQLLRPINEAVNTTLNMMIDAGHLQVVGGGFIGKGLSMHTGSVRFTPGEYKAVNVTGSTVKENIVPLLTPGPSLVLFQLLGMLIEGGKEISAVKDVLTGEQKSANIPATTTLALIEQGLKTFTAIYKRVHRALKAELAKLYRLNSIYLPDEGTGFRVDSQWRTITKRDYAIGGGVEPVSDPTMVSDMQKLGRAQFLLGFAQDPYFDGMEIRKRVLAAAMIERPEMLLVKQLPPDPKMMENSAKIEATHERTRAEATKDYAQAMLFMTQAQQIAGQQHLDFIESQLEIYKTRLEAINVHKDAAGPDSEGGDGGGLSNVEAPPSNNSLQHISDRLLGGPQAGGMGNLAGQPGGAPQG